MPRQQNMETTGHLDPLRILAGMLIGPGTLLGAIVALGRIPCVAPDGPPLPAAAEFRAWRARLPLSLPCGWGLVLLLAWLVAR